MNPNKLFNAEVDAKLKFKVKQQHIDAAKQFNSEFCVQALSVRDEGGSSIAIKGTDIRFNIGRNRVHAKATVNAALKQRDFDEGGREAVKPHFFTVEVTKVVPVAVRGPNGTKGTKKPRRRAPVAAGQKQPSARRYWPVAK